jgi:hypothetical protein
VVNPTGSDFLFSLAVLTAAATVPIGTGAAVRTADTLFAAFPGLVNKPAGSSRDHNDHSDQNQINGFHFLFSSA